MSIVRQQTSPDNITEREGNLETNPVDKNLYGGIENQSLLCKPVDDGNRNSLLKRLEN